MMWILVQYLGVCKTSHEIKLQMLSSNFYFSALPTQIQHFKEGSSLLILIFVQQELRGLTTKQKPGSVTTNFLKVDFAGSYKHAPTPHFIFPSKAIDSVYFVFYRALYFQVKKFFKRKLNLKCMKMCVLRRVINCSEEQVQRILEDL